MGQRAEIETDLMDSVRAFVDAEGVFRGLGRLVVACSGGGDSAALLDLLERGADGWGLELAVAHLDHGWRGEESAADARFVKGMAQERGLPFFVERSEAGQVASGGEERSSLPAEVSEAGARRARHRFFARVAERWDADAVALGHTADDRAETVLLNLVRGSGRTGLASMRPRWRVQGLLLVRPLLGQRRGTLRSYCRERGIEWRRDATNEMERFGRVRVRRRVLPVLEEQFPGAVDRLARAAALLADEEAWLEGLVSGEMERLRLAEAYPGGVALDAGGLRALSRALARRVVRAALEAVRGDLEGIGVEHVDAVVEEVVAGAERARDLPGVRARLERGTLRLLPLEGRRLRAPRDRD